MPAAVFHHDDHNVGGPAGLDRHRVRHLVAHLHAPRSQDDQDSMVILRRTFGGHHCASVRDGARLARLVMLQ